MEAKRTACIDENTDGTFCVTTTGADGMVKLLSDSKCGLDQAILILAGVTGRDARDLMFGVEYEIMRDPDAPKKITCPTCHGSGEIDAYEPVTGMDGRD